MLSKILNSSPLRPSATCKSWAVVVSCQGREEEESRVSGLQLAVAATEFLDIFRKLDLPLELLGTCHFLLSGTFQSFSFASCWCSMKGEMAKSVGQGLLIVRF